MQGAAKHDGVTSPTIRLVMKFRCPAALSQTSRLATMTLDEYSQAGRRNAFYLLDRIAVRFHRGALTMISRYFAGLLFIHSHSKRSWIRPAVTFAEADARIPLPGSGAHDPGRCYDSRLRNTQLLPGGGAVTSTSGIQAPLIDLDGLARETDRGKRFLHKSSDRLQPAI